MDGLRNDCPAKIADTRLARAEDYLMSKAIDFVNDRQKKLTCLYQMS